MAEEKQPASTYVAGTMQAKRKRKAPRRPKGVLVHLTTLDIARLSVESTKHPDTIRRWANGGIVTHATAVALQRAAEKLHIKVEKRE